MERTSRPDSPTSPVNNADSDGVMSRRYLLGLGMGSAMAAVLGLSPAAEAQTVQVLSTRDMENNGNLPSGFVREKVLLDGDLVGSMFTLDGPQAKADFLSQTLNPEFFSDGSKPNFEAIRQYYASSGKTVVMICAGAYTHGGIDGVAVEDGREVGTSEFRARGTHNGLIVIQDGRVEIKFMSDFDGDTASLERFRRDIVSSRASLVQTKSFVRSGGVASFSNDRPLDLRVMVERPDGRIALINFNEHTTMTAISQSLNAAGYPKVLGLDTGPPSFAMFYDRDGRGYETFDEDFKNPSGYTNLFVFYSD